jgi:ABC-type anion transport system duplicated permease subunit
MLGRRMSLGAVIYIVIGVIIVANHDFFRSLNSLEKILSAVLAVILWPLVALHIHIAI